MWNISQYMQKWFKENKLKSLKVAKSRMNVEGVLLTNRQMDICLYRVAFATGKDLS